METGSVVYSKAGHDINQVYLVIGVTEKGYLELADGKIRSLTNPKIKNAKHVRYTGIKLTEAKEKYEQGKLMDSDLAWYLKPYQIK